MPRELAFQHRQRLGHLRRLCRLGLPPPRFLLRLTLRCGWRCFRLLPASGQQLVERGRRLLAEVHVLIAAQRVGQRAVRQQYRNEAAAGIGRVAEEDRATLKRHPLRAQRRGREAERLHPCRLQPPLDGQVDVIPRLDDPFIEPHPQPGFLQPPGQLAYLRLILRVVAQKHIIGEAICHALFPNLRPLHDYGRRCLQAQRPGSPEAVDRVELPSGGAPCYLNFSTVCQISYFNFST